MARALPGALLDSKNNHENMVSLNAWCPGGMDGGHGFGFAAPAVAQAQAGTEAANGSESVVKRIDPTDFSTRLEVRNEYQDL
jgi:hypothetical protein